MLKLKVVDLNLSVEGDINQYFIDRTAAYIYDFKGEPDILMTFKMHDDIIRPTGRIIKNGANFTEYYNHNGSYSYYKTLPGTDRVYLDACIEPNRVDIRFYDFAGTNIDVTQMAFNAIQEAFRYAVLYHNGMVLYSTAICYNGIGIAFVAPTDILKSKCDTLFQMHKLARVINNDSPVIRLIDGVPYMFGTPASAMPGFDNNLKVALSLIVFLEQGDENTIIVPGPQIRLTKLMNGIKVPRDSQMIDKVLDISGRILSDVRCCVLKCTPDENTVDTIIDRYFIV